jgi:hypothetical protein
VIQEVRLLDGPLDGLPDLVDTTRLVKVYALDYGEQGPMGGHLIHPVTYRRTSPDRFTYCRTPTYIGDLADLDFEGMEDDDL